MQLTIIAAMANNRVIGKEGGMPWHLPADLASFKKATLGKTILMGYRTYLSLGRPLPKRRNLILTHKNNFFAEGCEAFSSLEAAFASLKPQEELMVIGGATLYEQTLPYATQLHLTFIHAELEGDTYFPEWNPTQWQETSSESFAANQFNPWSFRIVKFERLSRSIQK